MIDLFSDYYESLNSLSEDIKSNITELVFTYRSGVDSITVVFESKEAFTNLVGKLPPEIDNNHRRYAVDLESVGTDMVRMYVNPRSLSSTLIGYYVKDGKVYETKYYRQLQDGLIHIERVDGNGNVLSNTETEEIVPITHWKGPVEVLDLIQKLNMQNTYCCRKTFKDQCYISLPIPKNYK